MNNIEKSFEGLTSAFDTSFKMEDKDVEELINNTEKQVQQIEEKKNELVLNKKELMIKDQTFLETELKSLIMNTRSMLFKLETEIKIGSKSGYFDSYAKLSTAVANQLKELRELNVSVVQMELEKHKLGRDINSDKRATILLDANSLMEYVENIEKNNQMKKIDATFTIDENEEK